MFVEIIIFLLVTTMLNFKIIAPAVSLKSQFRMFLLLLLSDGNSPSKIEQELSEQELRRFPDFTFEIALLVLDLLGPAVHKNEKFECLLSCKTEVIPL